MEVHDDVFEKSALRDRLQPGEIFTIEPMIRFADDHTGMRIEDMLLITASGVENLVRQSTRRSRTRSQALMGAPSDR